MSENEQWTTLKVLTWTREYLSGKGVANARLESEWMLCAVTGLDRVGLYLNYDKPLNDNELLQYRNMVTRRAKREPLQHILGSQEFYGADFIVTKDVLIPRHDTEKLIIEVLTKAHNAKNILDIGTGSGCIAITLKRNIPDAAVIAVDISSAALKIAELNAQKHSVQIDFRLGSYFDSVVGLKFDLIVSNPPYIPTQVIDSLEEEVKKYDPQSALDGGVDGLESYRIIIPQAVKQMNIGGLLVLEIGIGQCAEVITLINDAGCYSEPCIVYDESGIERVISTSYIGGSSVA